MPSYATLIREPGTGASRVRWFDDNRQGFITLADNADSLVYHNALVAEIGSSPNTAHFRFAIRQTAWALSLLNASMAGYERDFRARLNLVL